MHNTLFLRKGKRGERAILTPALQPHKVLEATRPHIISVSAH